MEAIPNLNARELCLILIHVSDLTSFQDATEHMHVPEQSAKNLRLELLFASPIGDVAALCVRRTHVNSDNLPVWSN